MNKIKWGILSTAKIAETALIPGIKKSKNSILYSVASRDITRAKIFSKKHSIPNFYGSYEELYNDPNVDVIYNPLPNHLHLKSSIKAAKNKKHILIEKPITLKANEVDQLSIISKKNHTIITEAFMVRHHPQWQWIKKNIDNGFVGKIHSISSVFSYNNKDPKNIRNIKKYGGGALYDIGCYPIQISRFISGKEPKKVIGIANLDKNFKTDVLTTGIMDFDSFHSTFTVSTQSCLKQSVTINGSKKTIVIENPFNAMASKKSTIIVYDGSSIYRDDNKIYKIKSSDQYENQVTDFSNYILKKNKVKYGLSDAKKNMKVIDAFFKSIKDKKWIKI